MRTKVIAYKLDNKIQNSFFSDRDNFYDIDVYNLEWIEYPTFEFNQTINKLESMFREPSVNNLAYLVKGHQKIRKDDMQDKHNMRTDQKIIITANYHMARMYLDVIYASIKSSPSEVDKDMLSELMSSLRNWYSSELAKVSSEADSKDILGNTAICYIRKINLFARNIVNVYPEFIDENQNLIEPLGQRFWDDN